MKKDEEVEKIKSEGCPMLFCCSSSLFLDLVFFLFVFMFGDWWYQRKQGKQFIQPRGIKFIQHIYVISMIKLDGSACSIKGHFNKSLCTLVSWQGKSNDAEYYTPSRDVSSNQVLKTKSRHGKLEHRFSHRIQMKFNMFCNLQSLMSMWLACARWLDIKNTASWMSKAM